VQIPGSVGCTINGTPSFCGITTNAAKARINGVEIEANARFAQGFAGAGSAITLAGTFGYMDAKYKTFIGPTGVDIANVRVFQNTPSWSVSSTLGAVFPVGPGSVNASTVVSYRSLTHQFETASPFLDQPGYTLWDAHLTYSFDGGKYSIGVHGKNLTDVRYKIGGYQFLSAKIDGTLNLTAAGAVIPTLGKEGIATAFYGNPRQVFVTVAAKF